MIGWWLSQWAWYRRLVGGHWEYVFVEFCRPAFFWLHQNHHRYRPACEVLDKCEDY